jgi:DNA replication protein DnaC
MLDDRDGGRSTIITSQLPSDRWHEYLGEPTVADAILDRVLHRAHRLTLGGPSRRKPTSPATPTAAASAP